MATQDPMQIPQLGGMTSAQIDTYLGNQSLAVGTKAGMDITNGLIQGGLGIWNAVETSKNNKELRNLWKKQMALADEQIAASKQARSERASELARLNRIRTNTNTQYNTAAQVSRSY